MYSSGNVVRGVDRERAPSTSAEALPRATARIYPCGTAVAPPGCMPLQSPLAGSLALLAALAPNLAAACWDGIAVSTDKVIVAIEGDERWSPEQARHWATWIARIDALVPEGKTLSITHGYVEVCELGASCTPLDVEW